MAVAQFVDHHLFELVDVLSHGSGVALPLPVEELLLRRVCATETDATPSSAAARTSTRFMSPSS